MTFITDDCKKAIETKGDIQDIIGEYVDLKRSGASLVACCPFCNSKKPKLSVSPKKNIWKCYSCDETGVGYLGFVRKIKGFDFLQALKFLAEKLNITLEYEQTGLPLPLSPRKDKKIALHKQPKANKSISFRDQQLKESGLTDADQKYDRKPNADTDTAIEMDRYQKGSINPDWSIDHSGDDMVLHYMDLFGKPMTYLRKGTKKDANLLRVRFANPGAHTDKNGRPMRYQSPYGSGTHIWVNSKIKRMFELGTKIKTLTIQEGEKKADKATKHNMPSVGIMGIHNIANSDKQLPREFELLIKKCDIENIVFLVDGDYLDLSDTTTQSVDQRPKSFLRAVQNFRDYFYSFNNSGISLNIFFGYIKKECVDKGIDDLLANTLKGKENSLAAEIEKTMLNPDGIGKHINVHKITSHGEYKLRKDFFHMETNEAFAKFHFAELKKRKVFKLGRENFKFSTKDEFPDLDEDTLVLAQPLAANEEFWETKETKSGKTTTFKYVRCVKFLSNRNYGRLALDEEGEFNFIRVEGAVVTVITQKVIREALMTFVEDALQNEEVLEMLYKGARMYMENFNNLRYIKLNLHRADAGLQYMYFKDTFWKITAQGVEEKQMTDLSGHIWSKSVKDLAAKRMEPTVKVIKTDSGYDLSFPNGSKEAQKCEFLKYIWNTSNFYWRETHEGVYAKTPPATPKVNLSSLQVNDIKMHFISKMCGIGYMVHSYFDPSNAKAVIAMDGALTEVGTSNGRSGKTLTAMAIAECLHTVTIPSKAKDLFDDKHLLQEVTAETQCVVFDDVRTNFDVEAIFPNITGLWRINPKGEAPFTINREDSPKIFVTTNHALNGEGGSFRDRQFLIAYSDYYSENWSPLDEHKSRFFDEWDTDQYNRFYNFIALCVQVYFEHGLISAPMERLELRRLRQQVGEHIIDWGEIYYDPEFVSDENGKPNINRAIKRSDVADSFYTMFPEQKRYMDNRRFKAKLKQYCTYKGFEFNPGKKDQNDKRNGIEYFTIADKNYEQENLTF